MSTKLEAVHICDVRLWRQHGETSQYGAPSVCALHTAPNADALWDQPTADRLVSDPNMASAWTDITTLATNDAALEADFYIVACRLPKTWDGVMPKIPTAQAA